MLCLLFFSCRLQALGCGSPHVYMHVVCMGNGTGIWMCEISASTLTHLLQTHNVSWSWAISHRGPNYGGCAGRLILSFSYWFFAICFPGCSNLLLFGC